jgi:hypothetical protein
MIDRLEAAKQKVQSARRRIQTLIANIGLPNPSGNAFGGVFLISKNGRILLNPECNEYRKGLAGCADHSDESEQ